MGKCFFWKNHNFWTKKIFSLIFFRKQVNTTRKVLHTGAGHWSCFGDGSGDFVRCQKFQLWVKFFWGGDTKVDFLKSCRNRILNKMSKYNILVYFTSWPKNSGRKGGGGGTVWVPTVVPPPIAQRFGQDFLKLWAKWLILKSLWSLPMWEFIVMRFSKSQKRAKIDHFFATFLFGKWFFSKSKRYPNIHPTCELFLLDYRIMILNTFGEKIFDEEKNFRRKIPGNFFFKKITLFYLKKI